MDTGLFGLDGTELAHDQPSLLLKKWAPKGPGHRLNFVRARVSSRGPNTDPLPLLKVVSLDLKKPALPATAPADCGEFDKMLLLLVSLPMSKMNTGQ